MTSLGDRVRAMGDALRAARLDLALVVLRAEAQLEHHADTHVLLTPRTRLELRTGRIYLHRRGHEPLRMMEACLRDAHDVPGDILLLAAQHVRDLVDPEAD